MTATAQGDDCNSAVAIGPGLHSADGPNTGSGAINNDGGVAADWYSFTAPCTGTVDVHSCISGSDTDLFIYENTCPSAEIETIAADDDGCTLGCCASGVYGLAVTAGTTYYIEWGDEWDNTAFDWELDYLVGGVPQPVISGINGSNLTFSSTDVAWTAAGAETEWVFEYGVSGFTPGSGTILNVTAGADTTMTGLNPETSYDVYITAVGDPCSGGAYSFTTLPVCPIPTGLTTAPLATTSMFDWVAGGIEVEWDVEYGTAGMLLGSGTQAYGIVLGSDTTVTGLTGSTDYDWYVRAVCDLVAPVDTFSLWVGPTAFTTDPTCVAPAGLDTMGGNPFNAGLIWTPGGLESSWNVQWGDAGFTPGGTGSNLVTGVTAFPEMVPGLIPGQTYEFYVQADCGVGDSSTYTGPYTWTQPTFCTDPSAGVFANLTTTSVDFTFTPGGTETDWTVEYGENGFTLGTGTQILTTNTTESISSLTPETSYCFYVQANCGSTPDSSSAWVGPFCVTTLTSCPAPTNLNAINITTTAANLTWQAAGSETEWALEWGATGFMPGTGNSAGGVNPTSTNPYYATGLGVGTTYDFYVQGICGAGDSSVWSGPYTFTTLCGTFVAPYDEAFDVATATPNCWTNTGVEPWSFNVSGGGGPDYGVAGAVDHTSGNGNYAWIDASGGIGTNELISPWIDISALGAGQAGYWIFSNNVNDEVQNTITLDVWNGVNWTLLGEYGGNNGSWLEIVYDIPAGIPGITQFRLVQNENPGGGAGSAFYNDLLVDDFFVRKEVPCVTIDAGTAVAGTICTNDANNLFDALTGYTDGGNGVWYYPNATNPTQSFTATDSTMFLTGLVEGADYNFEYVVTNGCSYDTVAVVYNWSSIPDAGGDGVVTTCPNTDVVLIQELIGAVTFGGTWSDDDATGNLVNGIFYPYAVTPGVYSFTYTVDNGACADDATVLVTVSGCVGIEENTISLEVYPNPVKDILTITNINMNTNFTVDIMDIQGKVVYTESYSGYNGNLEMNMNTVEDGVYIVRLTSEDSIQEVRVVKQ